MTKEVGTKGHTTAQKPEDDLKERIEGFNKELVPLLGKFELGLAGEPFIINGLVAAKATVISTRNMQKPAAPAEEDSGLSKAE